MLPDAMGDGVEAMVRIEDRGGVRVLVFDRPPVNAINLEAVRALEQAVVSLRDDPACVAVVVTGKPGIFSAGIDTRAVPGYDAATRGDMLRTVNRTITALYGLAKPVVAAVSGHALGAGLVLPVASDYRVVADGNFKLGLTEAAAGVPFPAGPLAVCQAALSPRAFQVLALGSKSYAPRARELAEIVDRVVEPARLIDVAVEEATARTGIAAYGRVKLQLRAHALERLRFIIEHDDDPLIKGWV